MLLDNLPTDPRDFLTDANLTDANLTGAFLTGANLADAFGKPITPMPDGWKLNDSGFWEKS